jgi:hypothetical protein
VIEIKNSRSDIMKKLNLFAIFFIYIVIFMTGCSNIQTEPPDENFDGLIMVNDDIYVYMGYEVPIEIDKSDILGKVESTVEGDRIPTENGQANFEIKGAKYAQYEDDIVVLLDNKWMLFKKQENNISGLSVGNYNFLTDDYSDEEIFKIFRTIRKYLLVDKDYEANIDSIIEKSFKECGIDDPSIIEDAKSNLEIIVSYPE